MGRAARLNLSAAPTTVWHVDAANPLKVGSESFDIPPEVEKDLALRWRGDFPLFIPKLHPAAGETHRTTG
jgi:hypothetical protein